MAEIPAPHTNNKESERPEGETKRIDLLLKSLEATSNSIAASDGKAASLLTALGIIFGLSAFSIETLRSQDNPIRFVLICVFGSLYLTSFLGSMIMLILTVYPRRKPKAINGKMFYKNYSEDIYSSFQDGQERNLLESEAGEEVLMDQIRICSAITHRKESLLRFSSISTITFAVFLTCLIVLAFI